jgi:hypothetical protein
MADTDTPPTDTPATGAQAADTTSTDATSKVYQVGILLDRRAVLSTKNVDTWTDPQTPVYLEGEDPDKARPYAQLDAEQDGKVIAQPPEPYEPPPPPGTVSAQLMKDLGWDEEGRQRMAQALHDAHPDQYPTVESALYHDPEPNPDAQAAPAVVQGGAPDGQ